MSQAAVSSTTTALTVADLDTTVNCEPKVLDTTIGQHLGMVRPTNIRAMIEANRAEIEGFGPLHAARAKVGIGSGALREVVTYYLNEGQALCLCALSRAPNAPHVRRALIEAFMELRRRELAKPATISVRPHRRALPRPKPAQPDKEGHGCVVIGGRLVWFESGRRPAPDGPGLVVHLDGTLAVEPILEPTVDDYRPQERGFVMVRVSGPHPQGIDNVRRRLAFVGSVVSR